MGLFGTGEDLRKEGINCLNQGLFDKSSKQFIKAVEKGDFESIILYAEAKWQLGERIESVNFLLRYAEEDSLEIPAAIKVDILKKLMSYDQNNFKKYKYKAAYLGDLNSMRYVFDCAIGNDLESAAFWLEKIISHEKIDNKIYCDSLDCFEKAMPRYSKIQTDYGTEFKMINCKTEDFNRFNLLNKLKDCSMITNVRKGEVFCELGRMLLVQGFSVSDGGKNRTEYYRKEIKDIYKYFQKACELEYLPANYYMALLLTMGIDCEKNVQLAKEYIGRLLENEEILNRSSLFNTINIADVYALEMYISRKQDLLDCLNVFDKIIGHTEFKNKIFKEIANVNSRYDVWDYHSEFSRLVNSERKIGHKIFVLNGKTSTCKRTMAFNYARLLHNLYYLHYTDFCDVDVIDIDANYGVENKIQYIKNVITQAEDEKGFKFIYFDQPYNISDSKGENYYHIIMSSLVREVLQSSDKIVFFSGDGDAIIDKLKSIGVAEYSYIDDVIEFNGYSAEEALKLLEECGTQKCGEYGETVCAEVLKIVENRNSQFPDNINYDEINEISNILDNIYHSLPMEKRKDIRYYADAFKKIESRLGIEKITDSTMEAAIKELESLVGLKNIKEEVYKIIDTVRINNIRKERGMQPMFRSMHMIFYGNPGTGKTTVARLMGTIFKELGVLEKGHLVEKSKGDLVSQYFGATAGKTKEILKQALNGVLFIDEAYTLTNNQGSSMKDYGQEAVEEILKFMSDKEGQVVVIAAGYKKDMKEFIDSNPGLESRFNVKIEFEDYSEEELYEIFARLCAKNDFDIEEGSKQYIIDHFKKAKANAVENRFGNARYVNQYFTDITKLHSRELARKLDCEYFFTDEELRKLPVTLFRNFGDSF